MAKPDKAPNANKAGGRENAPGQNTMREFVNDAGERVTGTMNDFHDRLREQGYRPVEDDAASAGDDAAAGNDA
jgi:hypothetical protein